MRTCSIIVALFFSVATFAQEASKNPFDLIEAALQAGEITKAQAVLYRVLAFRGDPHLPAAFVGDIESPQESTTPGDLYTAELNSVFADLQAPEQGLALRMLAPPAYVPGLHDVMANPDNSDLPSPQPDQHWTKLELTNAIIWYTDNDANAQVYVEAIKQALPQVLEKLAGFMSKAPLTDEGESHEYITKENKKVVIGNGGDGRLDIYVMPMGRKANARGYANPYGDVYQGKAYPGFLVMNSGIGLSAARMKSVLMHETMHLVQMAYPRKTSHVASYKMDEGVAKWSEDVWDAASQFEHEWYDFFRDGRLSLKTESYGTWTWYYFLTHELGNFIIDKIYLGMANSEPYKAMNDAIPGGFKQMWPGYTKKEWNHYPPESENSFKTWDQFSDTPRDEKKREIQPIEVKIDPTVGDYVYENEVVLKSMTRKYIEFAFNDLTQIRSVSIGMTHFWAKDKVTLRAMVQYESGWKYETWDSQYEDKLICFDRKKERILNLVLIYSNYDYQSDEPAGLAAKVSATNLPCNGFKGHVDGEIKNSAYTLTMSTDAMFNAAPMITDEPDAGPHFSGHFNLFSIKTTYLFKGTDGQGCSAHKADTIELAGEQLKRSGNIGLYPWNDHTTGGYRAVSGAIGHPLPRPIDITYTCPNGRNYTVPMQLALWPGTRQTKLLPNETDIVGTYDMGANGLWKFKFSGVVRD